MAKRATKERVGLTNVDVAKAFDEIGDLLDIQGANPFKVRAYRNAAQTVRGLSTPLQKMLDDEEDLTELPGIGDDMARYIAELLKTGRLKRLEALHKEVPHSVVELMHVGGLGPKKAKVLWQSLKITTVDQLEKAAQSGKIAGLKGFGKKTEQNILEGIAEQRSFQGRFKLADADQYVLPLVEYLRKSKGVEQLEVAGSYRRRRETVGDIDILVTAAKAGPIMKRFTEYPLVKKVQSEGETRGTVFLKSGLQVDLRIVPPKSFGAALVYFTGSKNHNIKLRTRAQKRNLRISEYGVFRQKKGAKTAKSDATGTERDPWAGTLVAGATEKDVYKAVDLPWIPPELREDRGEIEAAEKKALPKLLELEDIRGDLQMHSTWSDGKNSIEEMIQACIEHKYEYMALTDHSKALPMTKGLDAKRLKQQWKEIDTITKKYPKIRFLRSMEIDIHEDGSLDLEDDLLEQLDLVVVSIHSKFDLPAAKQTKRILKALSHPHVHILGHPTGRLINQRKPMDFDMGEVLDCAAAYKVAVELNAQPDRLDLNDVHLLEARKRGLKIVISTDAHSTENLNLMRYGVEQARRAWLDKAGVLNTLPLKSFLKTLKK